MRAGRLDRKIDLQRSQATQSPSGAPVEQWHTLCARRAASYRVLKGEERNTAPQFVAREQVEFKIRWSAALADLNPKDRLIYPALRDDTSPADEATRGRIFEIVSVAELGRREDMQIIAARRTDL